MTRSTLHWPVVLSLCVCALAACEQKQPDVEVAASKDETVKAEPHSHHHPNSHRPHDEQIYDEQADAQRDVDAALARAKQSNRRVLIIYGGNWCSWCWKLHDTMKDDAKIAARLKESYEVVLVSIHENEDFPAKYGATTQGFPYLTILDADGKAVIHQETGSLEEGDHHDPGKVLALLDAHRS